MSRERDKPPIDALWPRVKAASASARQLGLPDAEAELQRAPAGADFGDVSLSGAEALQQGGAAAAGCAEQIDWVPESPVPIDIRADTAVDFTSQIDAILGAGGHTHVDIALNPTTDAKGRVSSVGLKVTSKIIRPRWAGGRPSAAERELIKRVETFIKDHEERHRDLSRSVMQKAVCDALNQPVATAKSVLKKAICDLEPKAQEALDAKEGQLKWVKNASGAVVDFEAVGAKHDYHKKGCDPFAAPPSEKDAPKEGEP